MPRPAKRIKIKAKTVVRLRPAKVLKHAVLK
jgi:nucleoid DNA-binding protein